MVLAQVEARAALRYVEIDAQDNTGLALGGGLSGYPTMGDRVSYDIGEDRDLIGLSLRYT